MCLKSNCETDFDCAAAAVVLQGRVNKIRQFKITEAKKIKVNRAEKNDKTSAEKAQNPQAPGSPLNALG